MKNLSLSAKYLATILMILSLSNHTMVFASTTQDGREANLTLPINSDAEIAIVGSSTKITVTTWDKNEVSVKARILFKGKPNDKMMEFLDNFEAEVRKGIEQSAGYLKVDTRLELPNKVQIGSRNVGVVVSFDKDELELSYDIKVPASNALYVKDSYERLTVTGNYSNKVQIEHYSGDLVAGDFQSLQLELKYGHARINSCVKLRMEIYEEEIEINEIGNADIVAKYSTLESAKANDINIEGYESELRIARMDMISGELKYSELVVESAIEELQLMSSYESKIFVKEIQKLRIDESKYSKIKAEAIRILELPASYEDELMIGFIGSVDMDAKYLKMDIETLGRSMKVSAYEGEIRLAKLGEASESIFLDGKYNDFTLRDSNHNLMIDADIQYGDIDYNESTMNRNIYIKESSKLQMKASTKMQEGMQTKIILRGYEVNATFL